MYILNEFNQFQVSSTIVLVVCKQYIILVARQVFIKVTQNYFYNATGLLRESVPVDWRSNKKYERDLPHMQIQRQHRGTAVPNMTQPVFPILFHVPPNPGVLGIPGEHDYSRIPPVIILRCFYR